MPGPIDYSALARMLMGSMVQPVASIPQKPSFQNPTEGAPGMRGGGGYRIIGTLENGQSRVMPNTVSRTPHYDTLEKAKAQATKLTNKMLRGGGPKETYTIEEIK